ncbi:MAG: CBS domain-containing protein [Asgard group archaeon]|nr:CBS domain-containing protein [Asgard group archaeon]
MKVSEVMNTEYETIDKDQMLSDAIELLRKSKKLSRLIVTEDDEPVGVLTFRDVADRLGTPTTGRRSSKSLRVSSTMSYPLKTIPPNTSIKEAAQKMIENKISSLLVMEKGKLKGLVSKFDIISYYKHRKDVTVASLMTKEPYVITPSERVISARKIMMDNDYSTLPVVNDESVPIGIVDDETLADALASFRDNVPKKYQKNKLKQFYVGQVMRKDPPQLEEIAPLQDLIKLLKETHHKAVFIVNDANVISGIVSVTDITNAIAKE